VPGEEDRRQVRLPAVQIRRRGRNAARRQPHAIQRQQPVGEPRGVARRTGQAALRVRQGAHPIQEQGGRRDVVERHPDVQGAGRRRAVPDASRHVPARKGDGGPDGVLRGSLQEGLADRGIQGLHGEAGAEADLPHRQGHAEIPGRGRRAQQGPDDGSGFRRPVMARSDEEIVVGDPAAPPVDSPPVASKRSVELAVYLCLLALAALLAFDNWRTGMGWESTGPKAGYFPFYLSLILAGASLFGIAKELFARAKQSEAFVTRDQLGRVLQVLAPTIAFCLLTQWLGLYVASFLLIAGFMALVGRIAWWKSITTALVFSLLMFVTFEIAFDVIMPKGP